MLRFGTPCLLLGVVLFSGCLPEMWHEFLGDKPATPLVPARSMDMNPTQPPAPAQASYAPASGDTALTVANVGQKILTANPQAGLHPHFITIGSPAAEVFHRGPTALYITEGLVKQCTAENQLAAVLCNELGKMVAEREALAGPQIRKPDRRLPINVPYGNSGQIDAADQVRVAEEAKFDRDNPRSAGPLPPPDPVLLARLFLKNAHYQEADLDAVAPLLQGAQKNCALEQQLKAAPVATAWVPKQ